MIPLTACRTVNFSDVTNGYIYVLFGFFAHLYIIFSTSLYFSLEAELHHHTGLSKETIINYFACFSIILLLLSLALKWTWPIKIEEALIVIFIWILLRNLLPKDCPCCNPPPPTVVLHHPLLVVDGLAPTPAPNPETAAGVTVTNHQQAKEPPDGECEWQPFNLLYSVLCVVVMIASFLMNARSYAVSMGFSVLAIVLMIFTTLIPISCNQFNQSNVNSNLFKFTLYSIVWFNNRRKRLTEQVLSTQYLKGMQILYSYEDNQQNHLLCGVKHAKKKRKKKHTHQPQQRLRHCADECDDIACFLCEEQSRCLIPRPLFDRLDTLSCSVIRPVYMSRRAYSGRVDGEKARDFVCQLRNIKKIHAIHSQFNERGLLGDLFSWKNRSYDTEIQNIFDLTKTLWILNVCPIFLVFVLLEYILLNYHIHWNIKELTCLIQRIKVMSHIRCASND